MRTWLCWIWFGTWCSLLTAAEPPVDYTRDIKPVLRERCFACHGALKQESGLRLDTAALLKTGGDGGAGFVIGQPENSRLLERISDTDPATRMPPEGQPLTPEQIAHFTAWIAQGAPAPADEQPEADPRQHWSFIAPQRPAIPTVMGNPTASHPIDAFILSRLQAQGLTPQSPADPATLLRRVTLDLTGVPPTTAELREFLADPSPVAYERVVERLLASPRYGERWGRHWMDVWRYSDWYGRRHVPDVWNSAPQIWRWRDWIVKSLNEDRGYDRMVREMLAGDEVNPTDDEAGYATGYLIRNWYALNPNDWMRNNVEHAGKAFLGLTFNCAHCHDHKYDPITHDDYFKFRAFFEPIGIRQDRVPGEADPGPYQEYDYSNLRKIVRLGGVRVFDKNPTAPTWFYTGGDERNRVADRGTIAPGVPEFLKQVPFQLQPVTLPPVGSYPGLRTRIQETLLAEANSAITAAEQQLATIRPEVAAALPPLREQLVLAEQKFAQVAAAETATGTNGVLAGRQSLVLDAMTGRRILHHGLQQLKGLEPGTTIQFQLRILQDTHVNFQLAKDVVKGLTAGYVGFEAGKIRSYQPGSFTEFDVGTYDFAGGQRTLEVTWDLEPQRDRALLTVRAGTERTILTDHVPVAINGWNPVGDATKAITFDARTGSLAVIDEFVVLAPRPEGTAGDAPRQTLVAYDVEAPLFPAEAEVIGREGWFLASLSVAPATSLVTQAIGSDTLRTAARELQSVRRGVAAVELKLSRAEAQHAAAIAQVASVDARIAADQARYGNPPATAEEIAQRARTASQFSREATVISATAAVVTQDQILAVAEAKPLTDDKRTAEIEVAGQQLAAARATLEAARMARNDATQEQQYAPLGPTYPTTSTGRRKALAEWITNRQNPLAARVAVNHIWLRHFQTPLVGTVADFGRNGALPTHPELLDWLAVEFMESGWSMKHLHKLIVTSQAYQRSSQSGPGRESDPENTLLWRMNVGRMEAEMLRDSLLFVAGQLDFQMGGQELENGQALTTRRRTLYYSCHPEHEGKNALGELFDAPEVGDCYRRTRSVIPQQALALTNSTLVHDLSLQLTADLWQSLSPEQQAQPDAFITAAFERIISRWPTPPELDICRNYLRPPADLTGFDPARSRQSLVRILLNHNDFVAIR